MLGLIDLVLVLSCHHLMIDDKTSSSLYGFIYTDLKGACASSELVHQEARYVCGDVA